MLYLTCTTITSVDLAFYGVSRAKDWVSVDCGTKYYVFQMIVLPSSNGEYDFYYDCCNFSVSYAV